MKFTKSEIKDLFFAWILISIAFTILFSGATPNKLFLISFIISSLTVGIGFLLHELMHKYIAQNYGLHAEFKAFYNFLFLAIAFSFLGFIIAAPGAVIINGFITKEKNGKISLAGPVTNIILALIFLIPFILFQTEGLLNLFLNYGFTINALLATFNMIPIIPFDGSKVIAWNKNIYYLTTIIAGGLFILSFFI